MPTRVMIFTLRVLAVVSTVIGVAVAFFATAGTVMWGGSILGGDTLSDALHVAFVILPAFAVAIVTVGMRRERSQPAFAVVAYVGAMVLLAAQGSIPML